MLTAVNQRWRNRRDSYRPAREVIDTSRYEVAPIDKDRVAKAFVVTHHYSGSYPAARFRYGIYRGEALCGVAVFSVPAQPRCLDILPCEREAAVELGRFVLLDDVEANGESWFLARCFELLRREQVAGVVSFSDPSARTSADGETVFGGHIGGIYQALNGCYLGTSKAETRRLLPDGSLLHGRALTKIRKRDRGWRYAASILEAHGAAPLGADEDARAWVAYWVSRLTRPLRHPGNHKYAWALKKRDRRHLPRSRPYPKFGLGQLRLEAA